jgi:DNA-binding MarR family transcriptional regulator
MEGTMKALLPISLVRDSSVKPNGLRVYAALSSYEFNFDYTAPGYHDIAARAGISVRAVSNALQNLIDTGWVERKRRGHGMTNIYRCLVKERYED